MIVHRQIGTWRRKVARFIALSEFSRQKFIAGGLPASRVVVKPNFVLSNAPSLAPREDFLFVGRMSGEKGIGTLASAARSIGQAVVRVAGDGPDASRVAGIKGIVPLGRLTQDAVRREMDRAIAVIVPSLCYEGCPLVVIEAFAAGTPVIASRIGALAEMVQDGVNGFLFEPGNVDELLDKLRWAFDNRDRMLSMGRHARQTYDACFTPDRNYDQLMAIYRAAISELRSGTAS